VTAEIGLVASTASAEETRELAAALAALLVPADVVLLCGDLGAGKTTFTQGLACGLGITEPVTSPTFTLVRSYAGHWGDGRPMQLFHADVYRLDHTREILDLSLAELAEDDAAVVVEWGDAAAPTLAPDYLEVHISFGAADDDRYVVATTVGPRWEARRPAVGRLLAAAGGS
jgi:tRNA threonylcarbamoyladenosine biosynthesis protein TsaE